MKNTQAINVTAGNATATGSVTVSDNMPAIPCPDPAGYKYVGARYVPLFADPAEWNINSTYEPLTIVLNEGNSYTSKQYVPVGIQIDNEEYWAKTGNYNAQVEQYRQEVQRLATKINEEYTRVFDTHALMLSANDLVDGTIVKTLGYSNPYDNGGAVYAITSGVPSVPYDTTTSGLYAYIADPSVVTPEMFGAKGDGKTGDKDAIISAITFPNSKFIVFSNKTYAVEDEIAIYNQSHKIIMVNNATIKGIKGSKMGGGALFVIYGQKNSLNSVDDINPLTMGSDITVIGGIFDPGDPTGDTNCLGAGAGASNVKFINTVCVNSHRKAFAPQSVFDNVSIDNAVFINCRSGLEAGTGRNFTARNITIITDGSTNNVTTSDAAPIFGVNVANCYNVLMENVVVKGYSTSVTTSTSKAVRVMFNNCLFDGGSVNLTNEGSVYTNCVFNASNFTTYLFTDGYHTFNSSVITATNGITMNYDGEGVVRIENCKLNLGETNDNSILCNGNLIINGSTISADGILVRATISNKRISINNCTVNKCTDFLRISFNAQNTVSCFGNYVANSKNAYALYSTLNQVNASSFGNVFTGAYYTENESKDLLVYVDVANNVIKSKVA